MHAVRFDATSPGLAPSRPYSYSSGAVSRIHLSIVSLPRGAKEGVFLSPNLPRGPLFYYSCCAPST